MQAIAPPSLSPHPPRIHLARFQTFIEESCSLHSCAWSAPNGASTPMTPSSTSLSVGTRPDSGIGVQAKLANVVTNVGFAAGLAPGRPREELIRHMAAQVELARHRPPAAATRPGL